MSGAGRKSDKRWRDALILATTRTDAEGRTMLAKIAQKCVEAAVEGDMQAIKEIGDRIDGKAPQSLDVTTTHERAVSELTDAELAAIVSSRGSSNGTAEEKTGKAKPNPIH
jgi:hypothetical protein